MHSDTSKVKHGLTITTTERDGVTILTLSGKLVRATAFDFHTSACRLIERGVRKLVVDFGSVRLMDSSGLGCLVSVGSTLLKAGGEPMGIANLARTVYRLILIARIITFPGRPYGSVDEAVASLTSTPGTEGD